MPTTSPDHVRAGHHCTGHYRNVLFARHEPGVIAGLRDPSRVSELVAQGGTADIDRGPGSILLDERPTGN
jgi:hypothetical protein